MIVVIAGPTAVGKTKLSIELAKKLNGEIINSDSTQVYKGLDIATAKVTEEEKQNIVHHLIDIKDITQDYTLFDYQKDCRKKIQEIQDKGKIPIIVGGTGLYIKAALYQYELKEENKKEEDCNLSTDQLYSKLLKIYPETKIHKNNRKRILRSLNYYQHHHEILEKNKTGDQLFYDDIIWIGLTTKRETLYQKINHRVDQMLEDGLMEEAKNLYQKKIRTKAVMTPIGYKELFEYFDHHITKEEAIELIKQRCRRYAKRQYTWFLNKMNINWFDTDYENFDNTIQEVLNYINSFYE